MKTKKYKINKGLIVQKLDNKMVIFDSDESVLYTFDETASFIFSKLKLGWNEEKIVQRLVKKYKVNESRVTKDVNQVVKDLLRKKIITR